MDLASDLVFDSVTAAQRDGIPAPAAAPSQMASRYCIALLLLIVLAIPACIRLGYSDFFLRHGASIWVQSNDAIFEMQDRDCDVVIFGDSTAMTGIDPRSVEGHNGSGQPDQLSAASFGFALFPIVWFLPNTQQILGQETGPGGIAPSPGTPTINPVPAPTLFPRLRWRPNAAWLLVMAALAFASLAYLNPHARFLYSSFD